MSPNMVEEIVDRVLFSLERPYQKFYDSKTGEYLTEGTAEEIIHNDEALVQRVGKS